HLERVVPPFLAVVHEDEREPRVVLVVAVVRRRFLDEMDAAVAAAAAADDVGHQPDRKGERRDDIAIRADDEAGVLAPGIERHYLLVLVVRLARGAKRAERAAVN